MPTANIRESLTVDTDTLEALVQKTGSAKIVVDEFIAAASEEQLNINFAVGDIQALYILPDQPGFLRTNAGSAGAPDDTISLKANVPLVWAAGGYYTNLLTTDITTDIYITNSNATIDMAFKMIVVLNVEV